MDSKNSLFLNYANNSFRDDPGNLSSYVNDAIQFSQLICDHHTSEGIILVAEKVLTVNEDETPKGKDFFETILAQGAVFGRPDRPCPEPPWCLNRIVEQELKCYECDQVFFRKVLDDLTDAEYHIKGNHKRFVAFKKNYADIPALDILLALVDDHIKTEEKIILGENGFLKRHDHIFTRGMEISADKINIFRGFLLSTAAYSLIDFLMVKNNRRRLKKCRMCKLFFIPSDTKREICTDVNCVKEYRRKMKQKQRSEDPVTYVS